MMSNDGKATGELREPGAYGPVLKLTKHGGRDLQGLVTGKNPEPAVTASEFIVDADVIARIKALCQQRHHWACITWTAILHSRIIKNLRTSWRFTLSHRSSLSL